LFKNPNGDNRVRGLTSADNTRNYFLSDIPWDGYAVDRVDMLRGPNAILFGLGSPAGVINASTKEAILKNQGSLEFMFDKYGTQRAVLDYNREILPGELAFRVVALRNHQLFQQDPAFKNDDRIYAAVKYQPKVLNKNGNTFTINVNYENGNIQSNQPRTVTPGDNITRFWQPVSQGGFGGNLLDNSKETTGYFVSGGANNDPYYASEGGAPLGYAMNKINSNYGYGWSVPSANFTYGSLHWDGTKVLAPGDQNGAGVWAANNIYSVNNNSSWASRYIYGPSNANLPFYNFGSYQNYTLSDPSIFDFYHKLIDGPNKHEWEDWNALNADISATFLNGDIGFALTGFQQNLNNGQWGALGWLDEPVAINVDVNKYTFDGQPNPDAGRAYVTAENRDGGNNTGVSNRQAYRAQLFAKHDFSKSKSLLGRIIGEHDLQAVFSSEKQKTDNRNMRSQDLSPQDGANLYPGYYPTDGSQAYVGGGYLENNGPGISTGVQYFLSGNLATPTRTSAAGIDASNMAQPFFMGSSGPISVRHFDATWDAPASVNPGAFWQNPADPVPTDPVTGLPTGKSLNGNTGAYGGPGYYTQSWNPANYVGWVQTPMTLVTMNSNQTINGVSARDYLTVDAQKTEYDVNSKVFTWQGYLWDRAIVGMFGYRDDRTYSYLLDAAPRSNTATGDDIPPGTGIAPFSYGSANVSPGFYNYNNPLGTVLHQEVYSHNWSAVAHLNKFLGKEHDFLPINISLAYNRGMNYQPLAGRIDAFAHALPDPAGQTNEQSLVLATKDNKYILRLTHYDTKIQNGNSTGAINDMWALQQTMGFTATMARTFRGAEATQLADGLDYTSAGPYIDYGDAAGGHNTAAGLAAEKNLHDVILPAWFQFEQGVETQFPDYVKAWMGKGTAWAMASNQGVNAQAPAGFVFTEDSESKGEELEFTANPTQNWRLTINASKTTAARSNVPGTAFRSIADFVDNAMENTNVGLAPVWWDGNIYGGRNVGPYTTFRPDWLLLNALNGQSDPEVRQYHANMVTNYDFTKGYLKGVGVGAAYRWQDKATIGYAPMQVISPTTGVATSEINLNAPVYAPSQGFLDLWVSYHRKLTDKVGWSIQLNAYNVGGDNKLVPIAATIDEVAIQKMYPNGLPTDKPTGYIPMKPCAFRIQEGMTWQITTTFSF
jgi:hypothetical protein